MRYLLSLMLILPLMPKRAAADNTSHEFITSCTYGVVAGTLVGGASLAFTSRPGYNLNRVARGASIGLYGGILLGFYVAYVVPHLDTPSEREAKERLDTISLMILPTSGPRGDIDGLGFDWTLARF